MTTIEKLQKLAPFIPLIMLTLALVVIIVLIIEIARNVLRIFRERNHTVTKEELLTNTTEVNEKERGILIRRLLAADAIDPGPNLYMLLSYGSKTYYVRSFTITNLPNNIDFVLTMSELMNFPSCTTSYYIHPLSEAEMIAQLDRHTTMLESEILSTQDTNARRKLSMQKADTERTSIEIESGRTRLYDVGAIFTIFAETREELDKQSDLFRSIADGKRIEITGCYTLQSEAFLANAPLNSYVGHNTKGIVSSFIAPSPAVFNKMDKLSLSALYNYTQSTFTHKKGAPLGRDLFTRKPVLYNIYDPSHQSYVGALFGQMGSGKSLTVKILCIRNRIFGYRFCALDGQERKGFGHGEYADLAVNLGGHNFMLSPDSDNVLNIFDVSESVVTQNGTNSVTTLELAATKNYVVSTLFRIIQGDKPISDFNTYTYLNKVITDLVTKLYDNFGIYDQDPNSLYLKSNDSSGLSSGYEKKPLPTLTDFYKLAVRESIGANDPHVKESFNLIFAALGNYVREIYYSEKTGHFFTAQEYNNLPVKNFGGNQNVKEKCYTNQYGEHERVKSVRGVRTYFDGQSTLSIDIKNCPFLNIDISRLQEDEKRIARIVGMGFLNERVIKKNSEVLDAADKLLLIVDEFHEIIKDSVQLSSEQSGGNTVLDICNNIIRTARKRNVGMLLCSQTVREFEQCTTSQTIISMLSFAFVFKQPTQDTKLLIDKFGLTENQASYIVDGLGGKSGNPEDAKRHRGEACLIDIETKKVGFIKVDYLRNVEAAVVETDAEELNKLYGADRSA